MRYLFFFLLSFIVTSHTLAQNSSRADSLRGSISSERTWWNLKHYDLRIDIDPNTKRLSGSNQIRFEVLKAGNNKMQIELQQPMKIDSILYAKKLLEFEQEGATHYILFPKQVEFSLKQIDSIQIYFSGSPIEAKNAPWDGGIVWKKDDQGKYFAASAVQGIGASVWWPTKEHSYDEPDDGVDLYYTTDKEYTVVGNGKLIESIENGEKRTWHWRVINPINNYNISFNLGNYVNIQDSYQGLNGNLELSYYVLAQDETKAIQHFTQVKDMLEAMEYWFGPYPFYEDSYKLTQAPFVGMEHQSNVAWGNGFRQGYTGRDITQSGYGMKFDFMIVHESIHEWFGNSLTHKDIADMWLHEAFTTYGEALYVEYFYGKEAGQAYTRGTRRSIANKEPIQGIYNIHHQPTGDIYNKGANMLLTLRQIINDDVLWREILLNLQRKFRHSIVDSETVELEIASMADKNLKSFFDVYLRQANIPTFEYKLIKGKLHYRYSQVPDSYNMPIRVSLGKEQIWLSPTTDWKKKNISKNSILEVDPNFYVNTIEVDSTL